MGQLLGNKYQVTIKIFSHCPGIQGCSCTVPGSASEFLFEISQLCQWHLFPQLHNFPKHLINYTNRKKKHINHKVPPSLFLMFHWKFKINWNTNWHFRMTHLMLRHSHYVKLFHVLVSIPFLSINKQYSPVCRNYLLDTSMTITLAQQKVDISVFWVNGEAIAIVK